MRSATLINSLCLTRIAPPRDKCPTRRAVMLLLAVVGRGCCLADPFPYQSPPLTFIRLNTPSNSYCLGPEANVPIRSYSLSYALILHTHPKQTLIASE